MKKLLVLLMLLTPLAAHADSIKDLIQEALKNGEAKGTVTDGIAEIIGVALKTKKPVPITITKVYSFPSGCGRLHMDFYIEDGIDMKGKPMPPQNFWVEGNLCPNGQGPSEREFLEWKNKEGNKTGIKIQK